MRNVWILMQTHFYIAARRPRKIYKIAFGRYLTITNIGITSFICGAADAIDQKFVEKKSTLDKRRLFSFSLYGALTGVIGSYWYSMAARLSYFMHHPLRQALLYQVTYCPLDYMLLYTTVGMVEGQTVAECREEFNEKFLFTYLLDCVIYMPILYLVFKFVPVHLRLTFDNFIEFGWCIFLSYLKHNPLEDVIRDAKKHLAVES